MFREFLSTLGQEGEIFNSKEVCMMRMGPLMPLSFVILIFIKLSYWSSKK